MKKIRSLPLLVLLSLGVSSCSLVKGLEHNVTVVFEYDGEIIDSGVVNQFTNYVTPLLSDAQIPVNHEFYGWTRLNPDSLDVTSASFSTQYIEKGSVVHYQDIASYYENSSITLKPVFINIDDIPIPEYYIAIGWYAKSSTSGISEEKMASWTESLKTFLTNNGATSEDLENVKITPYVGDVATAGSLINKDRYNDILIGFGKNIGSTGGVSFIENYGPVKMGSKENRYITLLNEKENSIKVFNWLKEEGAALLAD